MRKAILWAGAALTLSFAGCAASDRQRADYHQWRAQRAADRGDYDRAAREQRKAEHERREANERYYGTPGHF